MSYSVALNFEDGLTRVVPMRVNETVADAAYRVGINIPLDCRDGACGTCRVFCEAGSFDGGDYIEDALTEDEAAAGYGLACQMRTKSDLVLRVAASSDACKIKAVSTPAQVTSVSMLSETTFAFTVAAQAAVGFLPGQYVSIHVPGTAQKRSYSFSSPPGGTALEFLVRGIPGGLMSEFLRGAVPGTALELSGPSGSFYLRDVKRPLLFLAGGTGLAPFLSMLGRLAAGPAPGQPIHLVYGVTRDADLVLVPALEAYAARLPGFSFECCVADEASAAPMRGYVTAFIEPGHLHGGDVDVYLCGPPPMVDAVRGYFTAQGVTPANFYYEKFSPAGAVTALGEAHH